jgi:hypothetical protein
LNFLPASVSSRTLNKQISKIELVLFKNSYWATRNLTSETWSCPACGCLVNKIIRLE